MSKSIFIITAMLIFGCGKGYEIKELYQQRIENSTFSIIEFQLASPLTDGHDYGFILKTSPHLTEVNDLQSIRLNYLSKVPTIDTINAIEFIQGGGQIPELEFSKTTNFDGVIIVTDYYKYSLGRSMNLSYSFKEFEESNDSLILKGLGMEYFNVPTNGKKIGFKKGNIKLVESKDQEGVLESIKVPAVLATKYIGGSIDNITIIRNDSLNVNGLVFFEFIPVGQLKIAEFSNHGTYKKKKVLNKYKI